MVTDVFQGPVTPNVAIGGDGELYVMDLSRSQQGG